MKNSSPFSAKIILLFSLLFGFSLFFGQKQSTTLQKLQLNDKVIGSAKQSVTPEKEKTVLVQNQNAAQSFSINSNSEKKNSLKNNTARIPQADKSSSIIPQLANNNDSPFAAMKGKQEDLAKRTIDSKHFKNTDGSMTAVIGSGPIHYKNKSGRFSDIDHAIQKNTDGIYSYANKTNLFESYFGATSDEGIKNSTAEGELKEFLNTKMYWEVKGKEVGTLQSANSKIKIKEDQAFYPNLYGNISAEFTVETGRRKLNYIIPNKSSLGKIPANAEYLVFSEDIILPKGWTHKVTKDGILEPV